MKKYYIPLFLIIILIINIWKFVNIGANINDTNSENNEKQKYELNDGKYNLEKNKSYHISIPKQCLIDNLSYIIWDSIYSYYYNPMLIKLRDINTNDLDTNNNDLIGVALYYNIDKIIDCSWYKLSFNYNITNNWNYILYNKRYKGGYFAWYHVLPTDSINEGLDTNIKSITFHLNKKDYHYYPNDNRWIEISTIWNKKNETIIQSPPIFNTIFIRVTVALKSTNQTVELDLSNYFDTKEITSKPYNNNTTSSEDIVNAADFPGNDAGEKINNAIASFEPRLHGTIIIPPSIWNANLSYNTKIKVNKSVHLIFPNGKLMNYSWVGSAMKINASYAKVTSFSVDLSNNNNKNVNGVNLKSASNVVINGLTINKVDWHGIIIDWGITRAYHNNFFGITKVVKANNSTGHNIYLTGNMTWTWSPNSNHFYSVVISDPQDDYAWIFIEKWYSNSFSNVYVQWGWDNAWAINNAFWSNQFNNITIDETVSNGIKISRGELIIFWLKNNANNPIERISGKISTIESNGKISMYSKISSKSSITTEKNILAKQWYIQAKKICDESGNNCKDLSKWWKFINLQSEPPQTDQSWNRGIVCITNDWNMWIDDDDNYDCN